MISMRGKTAADGNYYIDTAMEYHDPAKPGEAPGLWSNTKASHALGLAGRRVEGEPFRNLCNGYATDGVKKLRQNAGKKNAQAFTDVCASDPKGLSLFEALGDDDTRAIIAECRSKALAKVIEAIESRAVARLGKNGRGGLIKGSIVVGGFRHVTSRTLDVQSHTHMVILSQILCADGKFRACEWKRTLYEKGFKKCLGSIYRTEMTFQLQNRLGLEMTRLRCLDGQDSSMYDLKVMQEKFQPLLKELSQRRTQILELLAKKGESLDAKNAARAVLESRPTKRGHLSENEVRERTKEAAERHGLFPEMIRDMLNQAKVLPKDHDKAYAEILKEAVTNLTKELAHFTKVQIEKAVFETSVCRGLPVSVIHEKLAATFGDPKSPFIKIGPEHESRYTTAEILKEEKKMFTVLDEMHKRKVHPYKSSHLERVIKANPELTKEQLAALRELTSSKSLVVVDGFAGTGKSTVLKHAAHCWDNKFTVLGCAVSAKAAQGLQDATGFKCVTLAKLIGAPELGFKGDLERGLVDTFKHHVKMFVRAAQHRVTWTEERIRIGPKSVIVLDESSLVSSKDLLKLATACTRAKAKLVLTGDAAQIGPLGRGAPFPDACKRYGAVTLTTIVRQEENWHRRAVKLLSAGRPERALREFARRGLVDVSMNRRQAIENLVASFAKGDLRDTRDRLALASKNADVDLINRKIQQARRSAGFLGNSVVDKGQLLFEGDRVLFRKNSKTIGVQNGTFGVVQAFDEKFRAAFVRLDSGKVVKVDLRQYTDLTLGYSSSIFRAQGVTQQKVLVLGDNLDRATGYVALSRSRKETRIFLSKDAAGEHLAAFAKSLKTDNTKTLATSHLQVEQKLTLEKRL